MINAPIVIVDDDMDDQAIIQDIWKELPYKNELIFFSNGKDALEYLQNSSSKPFLVICDLNLRGLDGFELRQKLWDSDANHKSIPFVYWSNYASDTQVSKAYDLGVQGFFIKEESFAKMKESLMVIFNYWQASRAPVIKK